ncbi:MAG TPA: 4a-hydroxytetrahydrobiopterin dehydratase [Steroidobacteraceae bacterium]|nr:4a-hydroxytetrahydrobiopterin dehydratase [Steroidobacteraceae bacterium]
MTQNDERLADRRCVPCEGGVKPYAASEARSQLARLDPAWRLDEAASEIGREFRFKDFYRVMSFVNAIAHIANTEDHHPDLELGYSYCRVRYSTHAIRGLSENDFICAAKIDRL